MVQQVSALRKQLLDTALPLPLRFRVLFSLRAVNTDEAVDALLAGLGDPSALFRHEVAFALGQMRAARAIDSLIQTLGDTSEHSMVRHEAAEALGAIALPECLAQLAQYEADPCPEVAETCQLALRRIQYWHDKRHAAAETVSPVDAAARGSKKELFASLPQAADALETGSPYLSVDPVPAAPADTPEEELCTRLVDEHASMFDRYGALFAMRNRGGQAIAQQLARVLHSSGSALLKHEVCYVLGQMQEPSVVPALQATLEDGTQHAMVRHEAAEAIGSIAGADCRPLLERHMNDPDSVVAEGCLVALDILDYEQSGAFEYCVT